MAFTSALLLIAPAVFLAIALRADVRRRADPRLIVLVYALPALVLVAFNLLWRIPATRVVMELHGIAFRSEDGGALRKSVRLRTAASSRVVIGDVPGRRRRVPQALFGTFVFRPAKTAGTVAIELPPPHKRAGLIATSTEGILGAIPIEDGDAICIGDSCWTYSDDDRAFSANGQTFRIPRREARIPGLDLVFVLPFARPLPATARTFALDALARAAAPAPADRVRSFVCHTRRSRAPLFVPLDSNVSLRRGGKNVTARDVFDVAAGERITFYTVPVESPSFEAPGVAERRSVVLQPGQRSFALDFDTPEVHSLTTQQLGALLLPREGAAAKRNVVALAMGDAQLVDRSVYFGGVSESVALQASSLIELSRFFPRDFRASSYRVVSPRGPAEAAVGAPVWIGASDLASIRLLVLRPPLLLLLFALALQVVKMTSAAASRFTIAQLLFAGALEVLAGVRLLFGHRVWAMPPHKLEAAELGAVAWMMLPWVFLAASLPLFALREVRKTGIRSLPLSWASTLAGLLVSMTFCAAVVEGPRKLVWLLCHVVPLAVVVLRSADVRAWLRARGEAAKGRLHELAPRVSLDRELAPYVLWAIAFCIARIVLLLFGFKESATLGGGRISLSAAYIPAAAILEGFFLWRVWQRASKSGELTRRDVAAAMLMLVFVWGIPAALTSDIGLALLNAPVLLLALLAIDRKSVAVRALAIVFVLVVAGGPAFRLVLPFISDEETLLWWASEANYARFLHFAAPERLQELATKRGESLAITSAILQQYVSSGVFGHGYGRSEVTVHLGDTALRDFAPAVFVAGEWGLAGTVAMLITYALFAIVGYRMTPLRSRGMLAPETRAGAAALVACLAAATIAVTSIYMILANHELLLLTGKNAYLLGLDSAGDVLETFALLILIAYGGAVVRDAAEIQSGAMR